MSDHDPRPWTDPNPSNAEWTTPPWGTPPAPAESSRHGSDPSGPPAGYSAPPPGEQPTRFLQRPDPPPSPTPTPVSAHFEPPRQPQPPWPQQPPAGGPPQPGRDPRQIGQDLVGGVKRRLPAPTTGWRKTLYVASMKTINLGPSPAELRLQELESAVRAPVRSPYKIGILGKGGVGKTTVAACLGSTLAHYRQNDRVLAVDADTAFGKLGVRIDPQANGSFWDLAQALQLESFADVRTHVGVNAVGLFVLPGERSPTWRRVLDAAVYREAVRRLDPHFTITIVDCGSTMDSPVTREAIGDLNALIVVSSLWVDGATAAGQTLEWLVQNGRQDLVQRSVLVLNDGDGHGERRNRELLTEQFASRGLRVIEVPFDARLRPGGSIEGPAVMTPKARRAFLEVGAAVVAQP